MKKESIFSEQTTEQLPLNYRFFTAQVKKDVRELSDNLRLSTSKKHHSSSFLNYSYHKPISNIETHALFNISSDSN